EIARAFGLEGEITARIAWIEICRWLSCRAALVVERNDAQTIRREIPCPIDRDVQAVVEPFIATFDVDRDHTDVANALTTFDLHVLRGELSRRLAEKEHSQAPLRFAELDIVDAVERRAAHRLAARSIVLTEQLAYARHHTALLSSVSTRCS